MLLLLLAKWVTVSLSLRAELVTHVYKIMNLLCQHSVDLILIGNNNSIYKMKFECNEIMHKVNIITAYL